MGPSPGKMPSKQYATQQSDLQGPLLEGGGQTPRTHPSSGTLKPSGRAGQPTMMSARQAQARTIQETREMMGRTDRECQRRSTFHHPAYQRLLYHCQMSNHVVVGVTHPHSGRAQHVCHGANLSGDGNEAYWVRFLQCCLPTHGRTTMKSAFFQSAFCLGYKPDCSLFSLGTPIQCGC